MALALNEDIDFSQDDPRVKSCIVDFLATRMQKYAAHYGWAFDQSDFDSLGGTAVGSGDLKLTRSLHERPLVAAAPSSDQEDQLVPSAPPRCCPFWPSASAPGIEK